MNKKTARKLIWFRFSYVILLFISSMGIWAYFKVNEWKPQHLLPSLDLQNQTLISPQTWNDFHINGSLLLRPFQFFTNISSGQSFESLLKSNFFVTSEESYSIIHLLKNYLNFKSIKPSEKFYFLANGYGTLKMFQTMEFKTAPNEKILIYQENLSGKISYKAVKKIIPIKTITRVYYGKITSSLSESLIKQHVPISVINKFIGLLAYEVDFQRDIQQNDSYVIYYKDNVNVHTLKSIGEYTLYYVQLNLHGQKIKLYRFKNPRTHKVGFYHNNGHSSKAFLLRTPTKYNYVSSKFGYRKHPILGYSRMHKGIDFASPSGTPVYAAGNGVIIYKGKTKGYGNHIDIRHANGYITRYGHLRSIVHSIHVGARVKQKQIIGYVGMTGLATGPHLHYEVLVHHKAVNPATLKLPTLRPIPKSLMQIFKKDKSKIDFIVKNNI